LKGKKGNLQVVDSSVLEWYLQLLLKEAKRSTQPSDLKGGQRNSLDKIWSLPMSLAQRHATRSIKKSDIKRVPQV